MRLVLATPLIFILPISVAAQDSVAVNAKFLPENFKSSTYRHHLDSSKQSLQLTIDSLNKLKLPSLSYQHSLDSLNKIDPANVVREQETKILAAQNKINSAEQKIKQKLSAAEGSGNTNLPGGSLPSVKLPDVQVPNVNLPNTSMSNTSLPNASLPQLPNASLPTAPNIPGNGISKDVNGVSGLPQKELGELKNIGEVKSAEKELGQAGGVARDASAYKKDVEGVVSGDSASVAKLTNKLEGEAKNIDGVKALGQQTQQLDQAKKLTSVADDPKALEAKAIEDAKKQAINHFAGKEQILQSAMDQVSKLKQKYSSLSSLSAIPKRIPNEMKGKPFIERLVPGINFQILKSSGDYRIDYNPYVGYRLTGHITLGAGWNERVDIRHHRVNAGHRFYGPRVFGEYRLPRGYYGRLELETMNTIIPPNQIHADPHHRTWVWGSALGIKKRYKLYKNIYGTSTILYNLNSLFDKHHINLYGDPLGVRIGFEFPLMRRNSAMIRQ